MSAPSRARKRARSPAASDPDSDSATRRVSRRGSKPRKKEQADSQASAHSAADGPVYDSCNEVRRKIRAFLRKGDTTIAAFLRELGGINSNSYRQFMAMKEPTQGSGNRIYPAAYHFFERRRLAEGKPKSKLRQESEAAFPDGYSLQPSTGRYLVLAGTVPVVDRIGRVSIVPQFSKPHRRRLKQLEKLLDDDKA